MMHQVTALSTDDGFGGIKLMLYHITILLTVFCHKYLCVMNYWTVLKSIVVMHNFVLIMCMIVW